MRMYRIVRELGHHVPYIIQGDTDTPGVWTDITRFYNPDHARQNLADIQTRQREQLAQPDPFPLHP